MVSQNSNDSSSAEPDAGMKVDVFQAHTRQISQRDLPLLHELTVGVFWPHRARDLELFMQLGDGYLALDEIERPLSSAMKFPMGSDFAMLGMMITAPRLQSMGTGRWLLRRLMKECEGRDMRLSATRAGYRLYEGAGFIPVTTIRQQQGRARAITLPDPVPGVSVRPMQPDDVQAICALDHQAFGADRALILELLLTRSEVLVAERAGQIVGFAMIRNFGKGQVMGPVVAESDMMAMQLTGPMIQAREGAFLRLDTPVEEGQFTAFLAASGLGVFDTVTEMRVGPQRRATEGAVTYGLAAHSLG
jgi:ribosomal protein S18 acetylase RimI-like enzyme